MQMNKPSPPLKEEKALSIHLKAVCLFPTRPFFVLYAFLAPEEEGDAAGTAVAAKGNA